MDSSVVTYQGQPHLKNTIQVKFLGAGELKKGQPLTYVYTNGKTDEVNEAAANGHFAGVAAFDYPAKAGQLIHIYGPGSVCEALTKAKCAIGKTVLKVDASDKAFSASAANTYTAGTAVALETKDTSGGAALTKVLLCSGGHTVPQA